MYLYASEHALTDYYFNVEKQIKDENPNKEEVKPDNGISINKTRI